MTCITSLIIYYSQLLNVNPAIVKAIIHQESKFEVNAVGDLGELGLFQLRPEFLPGYKENELLNPEVNIMIGIQKLKEAKKGCKNKDKLNYVICLNRGIAGGNRVKSPENDLYVKNVTKFYKEYNGNDYTSTLFEGRNCSILPRTSW